MLPDAFRDRAAKQAAALAHNVAESHTEHALRELDTVRHAFAAAVKTLEAALKAPHDVTEEAAALADQLTASANQEATALVDRARKEHDARLAEVNRELDGVRAHLAEIEAERNKQDTKISELTDALTLANAATETLQSEHTAAEADLKAANAREAVLHNELQAMQQQADATAAELEAVTAKRAELEKTAKQAEAAWAEEVEAKGALERELADARTRAENAAAETGRVTAHFEGAIEELRREHAEALREQMVASTALPLNELLNVFHALDTAASVGDVLTTLVGGLAREFSRVALFRVQGNHLEGMQQAGFEFDRDISKLVFPLSVDSMLTRAATTATMDVLIAAPETTASLVPFGGSPSCALALPVAIHGETLAVIYADDSDRMEATAAAPQLPAQFAELLFHHAQLVLLRIATEQKTLTELREYATMLVNEIEYGYNSDIDAGRTHAECVNRLKDALECTRRIYAQRVEGEKPATATLLDERLAAVIDARAKTPFGKDLASLVQTGAKVKSSKTAKVG